MATPDTAAELLKIDPDRFDAVLFDMDGVITDTAVTHAAAWSRLFDEFLATCTDPTADTRPFDDADYRRYVDGRTRLDGITSFLGSRGIVLPLGRSGDEPGTATVHGLAMAKNRYFLEGIDRQHPRVFESSVRLAERLRERGVDLAIVSGSQNRAAVLDAAGVAELFTTHVDGIDARMLGLSGKPDPAMFLEAARRLNVSPDRAVVIEDAAPGVRAGLRGGFGLVIGVARGDEAEQLRAAGADHVVADLAHVAVGHDGFVATDDEWKIDNLIFDEMSEGHREALCTLGNGVFAVRGAAPESTADQVHYPGTYAGGLYNRLVSDIDGQQLEHESLVNLPNWLPLSFRPVEGQWLDLASMAIENYRQLLDLRRGILSRRFDVTDRAGRTTTVSERRLVHMGRPHLAALEWRLTPRNWSGRIEVRSGLAGGVSNRNVADESDLAGRHLDRIITGSDGSEMIWLTARTCQSQRHVGVACRTRITAVAQSGDPSRHIVHEADIAQEADSIEHRIELEAVEGGWVRVEKVTALVTSLDDATSDVCTGVLDELGDAPLLDDLVVSHILAWEHLWRQAHVALKSDDTEVARTLNLHTFHVLQTLSPQIVDRDVGVGARGLHGEGYRGHVFWDELFIFPYLNLRLPDHTRELLLYRYRRLPAARRLARDAGCRGARFPWQSGSDGREETPPMFFNPRSSRWMPDNSYRQHHVGLAVAYDVWQYYQATGDLEFLANYGAEMLVEIARFWVDKAELDRRTGRYSIRRVMGPDEFHDGYPDRPGSGIDDNAYTNLLVSWLLRRSLDVRHLLRYRRGLELWERLGVSVDEVSRWEDVSRRLRVPFHRDGIISQFEGYEQLPELDWDDYRRRYGNIGRLDLILEAEGGSTNRYRSSKQADVLMLFYLFSAEELTDLFEHLGYDFDPSIIPATIDFYTSRTSHGSTLSRVVTAWVLARGNRARSWDTFREALLSDVADIQGGTTREGIHLGAMAGTIDLVQRGYTGIRIHDDILWFDPCLPEELTELHFPLRYRGHHLEVSINHRCIALSAEPCMAAPIMVGVDGTLVELEPGRSVSVNLA